MSERRRSRGRGRGESNSEEAPEKSLEIPWSGLFFGLLAVMLALNLVVALLAWPERGNPNGFVTPELLLTAAYWVPIVAYAIAVIGGLFWVYQATQTRERSAYSWQRRGFFAALIMLFVFVTAVGDPVLFPREVLAAVAALVASVPILFFARAARAEASREREHGRPRKSKSPSNSASKSPSKRGEDELAEDVKS